MRFLLRVILKALALFLVANILFALWAEPGLGRVTAYNWLFPGRLRFPFGETPREAYNFSLFNLDAMFASHEIAGKMAQGKQEFRVIMIGDSSVWGTLLRPQETLAGQLNAAGLKMPDGAALRFYNLGYPTISLAKDLLVLDRAMSYQPDLVIWLVTLEAFPREKQLSVPLLQNNPERTRDLLAKYQLDLPGIPAEPSFFDRTIIGRRKDLADLTRLQFYGILWAATGIDQAYPLDYPRAQVDLEADPTFYGKEDLADLALAGEVLAAGKRATGNVPVLLVNEPIMVSSGANSDMRYNFYYPRQMYDQYRAFLADLVSTLDVDYLDTWDIVPQDEFTNSAIHLNSSGTSRLTQQIKDELTRLLLK